MAAVEIGHTVHSGYTVHSEHTVCLQEEWEIIRSHFRLLKKKSEEEFSAAFFVLLCLLYNIQGRENNSDIFSTIDSNC